MLPTWVVQTKWRYTHGTEKEVPVSSHTHETPIDISPMRRLFHIGRYAAVGSDTGINTSPLNTVIAYFPSLSPRQTWLIL